MENIKELPNEWYQATGQVDIDNEPQLEPVTTNVSLLATPSLKTASFTVYCQLFVPAGRVYPMTEQIPFHVQVNGRVDSLRALLGFDARNAHSMDQSSSSSRTSPESSIINVRSNPPPPPPTSPRAGTKARRRDSALSYMEKCERSERLRVCIIRQVTVQLNSKKQIKNYIVAEGSMKADPPDPSDCYCYPMRNSELKYLSWTGSLKVNKDVKTGGFEGEYIKVSDFVALIIGKSVVPWPDVRCSVGIKLVTDAWEDPPEVPITI